MGRIIDLQFNDKNYSIEYNRESIVKLMENYDEKAPTIEIAIKLIQCGLMKNHQHEMPEKEQIVSWLLMLGDDLPKFVEALQESVQEVLKVIESEQKTKNLKWVVRK